MPVEIEIKLKVDDLAIVRRRLEELRAARVKETLETNLFFDTADRSLRSSDRGLRVRRNRDIHSGKEKLIVTYKGPRAAGPVKSREEIEMSVDSLDAAAAIFARLGFAQVLSFEKKRETWTLDRCTIELDQLPQLGSFIEIEGPSQDDVLSAREKLGLTDVPLTTPTYAELVSHHLAGRGTLEATLSFAR